MPFSKLHLNSHIIKAIHECGYKEPTPIQLACIPAVLSGKDIIASARTGTGKTAAFVLPALNLLAGKDKVGNKATVLVLTPTRELAAQITEAAIKYGKFLRFKIVSIVGGMSFHQQSKNLSRSVDVIVATPGRLLDHMENEDLDLSSVKMLVLDEADRMLDMGFIDDVKTIAKATSPDRQTLLFSATVNNKLATVINRLLKDPVKIDMSDDGMSPVDIDQILYMADSPQHKAQLFQHLLSNETIYKAVVFCATKISTDRLAKQLSGKGFAASPLHGGLRQNVRNKTLEQLKRGKIQFLIATDVAARGIDISDISHVFNYDLPKFMEDYVHRIGRTGRAGKSGIAISLGLPSDARNIQSIERYLAKPLKKATIPGLEPTKQHYVPSSKPGDKKKRYGGARGNSMSGAPSSRSRRPAYGAQSQEPRSHEPRPYGARSEKPRSSESRSYGERSQEPRSPESRPYGERSQRPRSNESRPYAARSQEPRSHESRPYGERSQRPRSNESRPYAARSQEPRSHESRPSGTRFSKPRTPRVRKDD